MGKAVVGGSSGRGGGRTASGGSAGRLSSGAVVEEVNPRPRDHQTSLQHEQLQRQRRTGGSSGSGVDASDTYEDAWDTRQSLSKILQSQPSREGSSNSASPSSSRYGCFTSGAVGEAINAIIPLHNQDWYHSNISRDEAERILRVCKVGSYLVRDSSDRFHYTLSIKSPNQMIHIQIDQCRKPDDTMRYILGKNSKAFQTIPAMVDHYTRNPVPIHGADHMLLIHPVQCHWSKNDDSAT